MGMMGRMKGRESHGNFPFILFILFILFICG
jgi:hypothetical protein